jgi:hypothetical protein
MLPIKASGPGASDAHQARRDVRLGRLNDAKATTSKAKVQVRSGKTTATSTIIAASAFDRDGIRLHGKFDALLGDRLLVHATRQPFLDGCRALLELDADPDASVVLQHTGSATVSLRAKIGVAAKLTVAERAYGNAPRFERWTPGPLSGGEAPVAQSDEAGELEPAEAANAQGAVS